MITEDPAIARYQSLGTTRFGLLARLAMAQSRPSSVEAAELILEIELLPLDGADRPRLVLSFAGVRDLVIRPFGFPVQLLDIDIEPIHDRQWEHLNYKVVEGASRALSFHCASFEADMSEP